MPFAGRRTSLQTWFEQKFVIIPQLLCLKVLNFQIPMILRTFEQSQRQINDPTSTSHGTFFRQLDNQKLLSN